MRRIFLAILIGILLLPQDSAAAVIRKKKPYAWEPAGSVKVLYETPLGKVYQFPESGAFRKEIRDGASWQMQWWNPISYKKADDGLHTLNLILYDNRREREERKERYIVIDFSIRAFPIQKSKKDMEGVRNNGLASLLLLASGNYGSITDLNGIRFVFPHLEGISCDPQSMNSRLDPFWIYKEERRYLSSLHRVYGVNRRRFPMYSLTPCRVIMEREKLELVAINYAGIRKIVRPDSKLNFSRHPIVTLALATASDAVLEIADPIVRFMEEKELSQLSPLTMQPYPYELYKNDRKSRRRWGSNPDFEYAEAMNKLYGKDQDWEKGLKEMRLLANKDHALAQFQAGCAYYRGIGCEADLERASVYFKDAAELEVAGALTMQKAIVYRKFLLTGQNEWNDSGGNAVRILKKEKIEDRTDLYAPPYLPINVTVGISGNPKVEFMAVLDKLPLKQFFEQRILQILDDLCRRNFTPAIYLRASYRANSPQETQRLYEKGAALGDPFCSMENIRQKMRSPGFQASMISINELWNARSIPFVHALLYGIRNPQSRYFRVIRDGEIASLKSLKPVSPEEHFLFGIAFIHDFLYEQEKIGAFQFFSPKRSLYFADSLKNPISITIKSRLQEALKSLEIAAEKGIPEAQYFVATPWLMKNSFAFNQFKSRKYLEEAAKQNPYALIRITQYCLDQRKLDKALDFLKRISDQKAMIALELRAQYLQLKQPDSPEAIAAWNNAGAAGSLEAMRFLGNYEYKKKNFKKAAAYRQVFLKTDAQQRNRDLNEIAWGDFFTCYDWSESSGGARFEIYSGMSSEEAQRLSKLIP